LTDASTDKVTSYIYALPFLLLREQKAKGVWHCCFPDCSKSCHSWATQKKTENHHKICLSHIILMMHLRAKAMSFPLDRGLAHLNGQ